MSAAVSRFRRSQPLPVGSALALVAFIAAMTLASPAAQAQAWAGRGSWCADMLEGAGFDCSFYSFQQCMATAWGMTNSCSPNPLYGPTRPQVRYKRPRLRR